MSTQTTDSLTDSPTLQTAPPDPAEAVALTPECNPEARESTGYNGGSLLSNRYRLVRELGRGGFGVVWLAEDTLLDNRPVAIKLLERRILNNPAAFEDMQREAAIALDLTHPRIVRLHIFDIDGALRFLVFEYLAGPTLSEIIRARGRLTLREMLLVLEQTAEALIHIHRAKMLHCDIKPSNIMLPEPIEDLENTELDLNNCQVKLTDLGISRALSQTNDERDEPVVGTPTHMAPELHLGQKPSTSTDLYALGCVIYQMLAGRPPFRGNDVVHQQINCVPREIVDVPAPVNDVIQRALAKRPQDRWPTVAALVTAMRAAIDESCTEIPALPPDPSTLPDSMQGPLSMSMRLISGEPFLMGSDENDLDHRPCEGPVHEVQVRPHYMGQYPVTVAEYEAFLWQTHSEAPHLWDQQRLNPQRPVVYVSWEDAVAFCLWMSKIGRRTFRLPTEAEWECAARGGLEQKRFPWGDESPDGRAAFNPDILVRDGSDWGSVIQHMEDVGQRDPNKFGLYDMAGLVAEWCQDLYQEDYYTHSPQHDPPGPSRGGRRVLRGGSWRLRPSALRCAARLMVTPGSCCPDVGFRVVCEI